MNSSINSCCMAVETRFWRRPKYSGSLRLDSLLVPQSRTMGRVFWGWIPAAAVYSASLPIWGLNMLEGREVAWTWSRGTYRDTDTVHTKITETENTRAISDDTDLGVGARPVTQHGADRLALLDGDVEGLGAGVEGRVLEADIANGRRIDKWHNFADIVHDETVEEVDVLFLQRGQVEVLVDGGRARLEHLHGTGALGLEALHGVGEEPGEVLGDALLGGKGEPYWNACIRIN